MTVDHQTQGQRQEHGHERRMNPLQPLPAPVQMGEIFRKDQLPCCFVSERLQLKKWNIRKIMVTGVRE